MVKEPSVLDILENMRKRYIKSNLQLFEFIRAYLGVIVLSLLLYFDLYEGKAYYYGVAFIFLVPFILFFFIKNILVLFKQKD